MSAEQASGDFGSRLRQARERKGISLRKIADDTKISMAALEALERDDVSRLPGGIFSRAFVRAFAVEVGLDPEKTVDDFVRRFPRESVTDGHPPSRQIDDADPLDSSRRAATIGLALAALSVPLAMLLLYLGMAGGEEPLGAVPTPLPAVSAATSSDSGADGGASSLDRLRVEVVALRDSSLSSTIDGQAQTSVAFEAGSRRTFDVGRELLLAVSDAGAVEWRINGVPARPLGGAGQPAAIRLTIENFREFLDAR